MNFEARRWAGVSSFILLMLAAMVCLACSKSSSTENVGGQKSTEGPQATTSSKTDANLVSAREAWEQMADEVAAWDSGFTIAWARGGGSTGWQSSGKEVSWHFYIESGDQKRSVDFYFVATRHRQHEKGSNPGRRHTVFQRKGDVRRR